MIGIEVPRALHSQSLDLESTNNDETKENKTFMSLIVKIELKLGCFHSHLRWKSRSSFCSSIKLK